MNTETLSEVLDDNSDYLAYKKAKTIEKLGSRTHLTLRRIAKLIEHQEYGDLVAEITLQELVEAAQGNTTTETTTTTASAPRKTKKTSKRGKASSKKKTTKKKTTSKKASSKKAASKKKSTKKKSTKKAPAAKQRKTTTKKAAKKKATSKRRTGKRKAAVASPSTKAAASSGHKADYGKKKPRLNREQGYKEILAALTAAQEPCGRGELEKATGYTGVQVRTFCKELVKLGKVQVLGKGGRGTKYALA